MKNKSFNIAIFLVATFVMMLLSFITLIAFAAKEEGSSGMLVNLLSHIHTVFEFLTYTICSKFIFQSRNFAIYLLAYAVNSIFYGITVERLLVTLISKNK